MFPQPQNRGFPRLAILVLTSLAAVEGLRADFFEEMGYTALQNALGAATPDGTGVAVAQIEGGGTVYLPQATTSIPGSFPGTGTFFSGKTFDAHSSGGSLTPGESGHAKGVAYVFYGNLVNPASNVASMTPGITAIHCFEVNDFISSLETNSNLWDKKVHNHSWAFSGGGGANAFLRKLDREVVLRKYLPVVGLLNHSPPAAAPAVPEYLASGYNVLSVGISNGLHSTGSTPSTMDGYDNLLMRGRMKPEVVAPATPWSPFLLVSHAVPQVSSLVALLLETALANAALNPASDNPEVLKAIVMAGATKSEFQTPSYKWSRSREQPLDAHYGAGEIHALNSHEILTGGEQSDGEDVALKGWDFVDDLANSSMREYTITVPADSYADELSIILTWNRVVDKMGPNYNPKNHDLVLKLVDHATGLVVWDESDSENDNVEHIYYQNLPAGKYKMRVSRVDGEPGTMEYAIAWRTDIGRGPQVKEVAHDGTDLSLSLTSLDPSMTYSVQRSPDPAANPWFDVDPSYIPSMVSEEWVDLNAPGTLQFYRLSWVPRMTP